MPIFLLLTLLIVITGCSPKSAVVYDPFAQVETIDEEQINTTERTEYLAFRYYHDIQEPSYLNYLQGIKESYRFTFTGDYEPDLIIRINHWEWSDTYSVSVKKRNRNSYHVSSCIRNRTTEDIYSCPPTHLSKVNHIEISHIDWIEFKELILATKFWSKSPELHEAQNIFLLHGTHWNIEGFKSKNDSEFSRNYGINNPKHDSNVYRLGKYVLMLADEAQWLIRAYNKT
ncbi:hypothetical protein [Kangiella taiwanensis]|uniref:Uncharacterized protein n=1 Tax=Kangiella taiwanensis TaxID=1079179 RepID=A0ABP8I4F0_9GAMM|nr:hypothetical protein [Kangiella taiwanensis]